MCSWIESITIKEPLRQLGKLEWGLWEKDIGDFVLSL